MKTPICDFAKGYAASDALRLHMPGHKGRGALGIEALDLTEIQGADVLYSGNGIIAESEKNATELFGSEKTLYSTEGSSLSIRAMLFLAALYGKENGLDGRILAGRNAHRVFHGACALLDLDVDFISAGGVMDCPITPEILENALQGYEKKPCAVYLTSPDYLGNTLDIKALSQVCHRHGTLCLVDNAHGAYLKFLTPSRHPLDLGADACADSAHKTLPALTGAAYLHISRNAPKILSEQAEGAMALFASTSPSYLILQSLDALNAYLADGYGEKLAKWETLCTDIKAQLTSIGYKTAGDEKIKITLCPKPYGYTGDELAEILMENGIVCEHSDPDFTVLMLTPSLDEGAPKRILDVLKSLPKKKKIETRPPKITKKERGASMKTALLSPKETVPVSRAIGRITANAAASCPPAIPITVCGEIIDEEAVKAFEYYGIEKISVLK